MIEPRLTSLSAGGWRCVDPRPCAGRSRPRAMAFSANNVKSSHESVSNVAHSREAGSMSNVAHSREAGSTVNLAGGELKVGGGQKNSWATLGHANRTSPPQNRPTPAVASALASAQASARNHGTGPPAVPFDQPTLLWTCGMELAGGLGWNVFVDPDPTPDQKYVTFHILV
jgi:hypothetical protein